MEYFFAERTNYNPRISPYENPMIVRIFGPPPPSTKLTHPKGLFLARFYKQTGRAARSYEGTLVSLRLKAKPKTKA